MANSGVNTGFAKCFILFMTIVILLQGCVYLGLSILGITMEKCANDVKDIAEKPFEFVLDVIYFANKECGNLSISVPEINDTYTIDVDWDKSFKITNRMNIFLITYAAVSALWIITSLMVLTTICGVVTKLVSTICYWPWFLVVMAGCVLDAVATGYHAVDIYHTTSANDTFIYTGIEVPNEIAMQLFSNFDAYFITPAVVMTCISSRFVLIWLLNIFGTIFCLSLSNVLAKRTVLQKDVKEEVFSEPRTAYSQPRVDSNFQQEPQLQQYQVPQPQYFENNPPQIKPKPLPIQTGIQVERQDSYQQQEFQREDKRTFEPLKAPAAVNSINSMPSPVMSELDPNLTRQISTYRNADTHPDKLDYPVSSTPGETRTTSPELSAISPLNSRYSSSDGPQFPNPQNRVSDELRSQLPWSYTSMLSKPQPPRRVQSQVPPTTNVYPVLPEPDYTLHPQRNDRLQTSESDINIQQPQSYSRW